MRFLRQFEGLSLSERDSARRTRLLAAADRARSTGQHILASADEMAGMLPLGQPVLAGHHSERRHRRTLERVRRRTGVGYELISHAAELERRAAAVGTAGISSDDPNAVAKLEQLLAAAQTSHERMKRANRAFPAEGWFAELSADEKADALRTLRFAPWQKKPFALTNSSANLRRLQERIAHLKQQAVTLAIEPIVGPGWTITEDVDDNRIVIAFEEKPQPEILTALGRAGFKWSPTRNAHVRMRSNGAIYAARRVLALDGADALTRS